MAEVETFKRQHLPKERCSWEGLQQGATKVQQPVQEVNLVSPHFLDLTSLRNLAAQYEG